MKKKVDELSRHGTQETIQTNGTKLMILRSILKNDHYDDNLWWKKENAQTTDGTKLMILRSPVIMMMTMMTAKNSPWNITNTTTIIIECLHLVNKLTFDKIDVEIIVGWSWIGDRVDLREVWPWKPPLLERLRLGLGWGDHGCHDDGGHGGRWWLWWW